MVVVVCSAEATCHVAAPRRPWHAPCMIPSVGAGAKSAPGMRASRGSCPEVLGDGALCAAGHASGPEPSLDRPCMHACGGRPMPASCDSWSAALHLQPRPPGTAEESCTALVSRSLRWLACQKGRECRRAAGGGRQTLIPSACGGAAAGLAARQLGEICSRSCPGMSQGLCSACGWSTAAARGVHGPVLPPGALPRPPSPCPAHHRTLSTA